jgi:DNA-binding PadR family transcriptional regulator
MGGMRRRRMRRGDVRAALLVLLDEQPHTGYSAMEELERRSNGAWRPSPGSVYPTLQLLEDEGLVRATERDGKRTFEITDEGRAEAERRIEAAGGPPWAAAQASSGRGALREAMGLLGLAVRQVGIAGSKEQQDATTAILTDARKRVYQLLGES